LSGKHHSSHKNMTKLDPDAVRKCAERVHGCREVATCGENVLSFMVGLESKDKAKLARINVYVETGTIGTCRVMGEQVREVFRRNVANVEAVEKYLRDPPNLTQIDPALMPDIDQTSVEGKMELAEVGVCVLMGEKEALESQVNNLLGESMAKQSKDSDDSDSSVEEGMEFEFSFTQDVMVQVEQCLSDISSMDKNVNGVGISAKGAVFLCKSVFLVISFDHSTHLFSQCLVSFSDGNGGVAYTPNIPRPLYQKLRALKTNQRAPRPIYVSLGTRDRYFVHFFDGSREWKGPKSIDRILKQHQNAPRSVAFGSTYDTFFMVFDDGSWEHQGRGIPKDLQAKLTDRAGRPDVVCVTLGPKGEWFLRAKNGRMWWGGVSRELDETIQSLLDDDHYLNFLDFGDDGTFFLTYD
jgi:hypothetical protein